MATKLYPIAGGVLFGLVVYLGYRTLLTIEPSSINNVGRLAPFQTDNAHSPHVLDTARNVQVEHEVLLDDIGDNGKGDDRIIPESAIDAPDNIPPKPPLVSQINPNNWTAPTLPEELANMDHRNPTLSRHIRDYWILPPFTGPRNLHNSKAVHYSQRGQSAYIDDLLKQRTGGFYIECGAANGEGLSNSLFFEKSRNWSGILIEANPGYFRQIVKLRRHAYMLHACLSPTSKPGLLDFRLAGYIGGLVKNMENGHKQRVFREAGKNTDENLIRIQCFPLLAILRALNVTHVDYFSLDIEGAEYEILKDFPFDEIQVDVLTIEYVVSGGGAATREKLKNITDLMIGRYGYHKTTYKGAEDIMLAKGV